MFRTIGAKSFWNPGGAFWYDAIIDRDGHILDIVTPAADHVTCTHRDDFASRAHLDLSRVTAAEICVEQ